MSSVGQYLITWNLHDVLKGKTHKYVIKSLGQPIICHNFKANVNRIVVAHEQEIVMQEPS